MSEQLQLRRDTQSNLAGATPAAGEPAYDTTRGALSIGDGATAGGVPLAALAIFGGYASGRYYRGGTDSTATVALTANTLYLVPFMCLQKQTFTKIGIEVTAAAGANGRLGVYKFGAAGEGGALILDAGAVSIASTGLVEISSLALALNPGAYGLGILPDTTISVRACSIGTIASFLLGASTSGAAADDYVSMAQAYGALPANFSATPTYLSGNAPGTWLRL